AEADRAFKELGPDQLDQSVMTRRDRDHLRDEVALHLGRPAPAPPTAAPSPATAPAPLPLATLPPIPTPHLDPARLAAQWPAFRPGPAAADRVNVVLLPFTLASPDQSTDPAVGYA